jgi:hypothetical protein
MNIITFKFIFFLILFLIINQTRADDPFASHASPPIHDVSTWTRIEAKGKELQNQVVTTYGWLFCKKISDKYGEKIVVYLFKSKDSLEAGFMEDSIRILITEKTINSYSGGDLSQWEKLHKQPVYVTGFYTWDKSNEVNSKSHSLEEPLQFLPPIPQSSTSSWKKIITKGLSWDRRITNDK